MSTVASVVNLVRPTNVASLSQWATTFPNKIAQSNLGTNHVATPLVANPCTATARSRSNVFAYVHARVIHRPTPRPTHHRKRLLDRFSRFCTVADAFSYTLHYSVPFLHSNTLFLGSNRPSIPNTSRSLRPFFHNTRSLPTEGPTDR